jgi:hypothetical protein
VISPSQGHSQFRISAKAICTINCPNAINLKITHQNKIVFIYVHITYIHFTQILTHAKHTHIYSSHTKLTQEESVQPPHHAPEVTASYGQYFRKSPATILDKPFLRLHPEERIRSVDFACLIAD